MIHIIKADSDGTIKDVKVVDQTETVTQQKELFDTLWEHADGQDNEE